MKKTGYLIFTTHDGDEVDATFVPDTETGLIDVLANTKGVYSASALNDIYSEAFFAWKENQEKNGIPVQSWRTQTLCQEPWPFNDYNIINTFYFLIY